MCDILIPALIGVGALALLGGGNVGGCDSCPTGPACAVTQSGNYTVTIPQLAGEGTNVQQVASAPQFAYAPPMQQTGPAAYAAPAPYAQPGYAPAPYAGQASGLGYGASVGANGQSALGAGGYIDPNGVGVGANVGGVDANIGLGSRNY